MDESALDDHITNLMKATEAYRDPQGMVVTVTAPDSEALDRLVALASAMMQGRNYTLRSVEALAPPPSSEEFGEAGLLGLHLVFRLMTT